MRPSSGRPARLLQVESLESRLNLSTLTPLAAPRAAVAAHLPRILGKTSARQHLRLPRAGSTPLTSAGSTSIPINSYSSLYNCQLENNGQPDIGWVSPSGAYVEYTLNVPTAGNYNISLGTSEPAPAQVALSVNGTRSATCSLPSTNSWSNYAANTTQSVYLPAGTALLRLSALNGTQYNLGSLSIAPAAPAGPITTVTSASTAIPVSSYSAIDNCQLENNGQPDIGYVSTSGAYVEYTLTVPAAGTYTLAADFASVDGGQLQLSVNGAPVASLSTPQTGAWNNYASQATPITLAAGTNVLRFSSLNGTQYNLANISLAAPPTPLNTWIPANTYTSLNNCQLENSPFGQDIGWVSTSGAYVEYTVNVPATGPYALAIDAATPNSGVSVNLLVDNAAAASFPLANTGGWQNYAASSQTLNLTAGMHVLRFASVPGTQYNLLQFQLTPQSPTPPTSSTPAAPAPVPPVTIAQRWMTSFTELDITATAPGETLTVSQSGNTFTINANGISQSVSGSFGSLMVYAGSGSSTITIDSSVNIAASLYGGAGNDILTNLTSGQATIVTLAGGADTVTGNGLNTAYWIDPSDILNASAAEKAAGDVHSISSFYQPYTTTPGAPGYVTNLRDGANLIDPAAATTTTTRLTASSFWGTGPTQFDVNQGQSSDCYFLTCLQSLARLQPNRLQQLAVDLGDGTYAVQFQRNGATTYVRVDGDLPAAGPYAAGLEYAHPGSSGNQWVAIMEKAYAYFRSGKNSYSSLDVGFMTSVWTDLGIRATSNPLPASPNAFYTTASSQLAAGKPVDIVTRPVITAGAPLVASHAYAVTSLSTDSAGTVWVTLRNPWGFDGFNDDANPGDGFVTLSYTTLLANSGWDSMVS